MVSFFCATILDAYRISIHTAESVGNVRFFVFPLFLTIFHYLDWHESKYSLVILMGPPIKGVSIVERGIKAY